MSVIRFIADINGNYFFAFSVWKNFDQNAVLKADLVEDQKMY